jgi:hypothetical protein
MNRTTNPASKAVADRSQASRDSSSPGKAANRAVAISRSPASRLNANWSLRWRCFPG